MSSEEEKQQRRRGRAIVLCLDKSGSMSGSAYDALKEGALLVAQSIFDNQEFEYFITIFYDSNADAFEGRTFQDY